MVGSVQKIPWKMCTSSIGFQGYWDDIWQKKEEETSGNQSDVYIGSK